MSNYLTSLIARTRGPSSRVEPRLRSIFEPVAPVAPKSPSPLSGEGTEVAGSIAPPAIPASPPPVVRGAPQLSAAVPAPSSPVAPASVRSSPISVDDRGARAPAEGAVEEQGGDLLLPPRAFRVEPSARFPAERSAEKRAPGNPTRTDPLAPLDPAGNGTAPKSVDGAVMPAQRPASGDSRAVSPPSHLSVPPRPLKAANAPVLNRDTVQRGSEGPVMPAIHVTIGRVDVRALFSSAAPAARRPERATPKVTLENYLEARNGGDR